MLSALAFPMVGGAKGRRPFVAWFLADRLHLAGGMVVKPDMRGL
jgi:hypothetical protein